MIKKWRPRLRRLLGGALYCPYCRERLDAGIPVLAIPSPSRLQAEHVASCPAPGARTRAAFAEMGRALQDQAARAAEGLQANLGQAFKMGKPDDQS